MASKPRARKPVDLVAPSVTCTRRLHFCAGHRVHGHENKCAHIHGHNYVVYITATAPEAPSGVDGIGRVIDFSCLKSAYDPWIQNQWDHGMILWDKDPLRWLWIDDPDRVGKPPLADYKSFLLPYNPTAENLARFLLELWPTLRFNEGHDAEKLIRIQSIRVVETENCYADYTEERTPYNAR